MAFQEMFFVQAFGVTTKNQLFPGRTIAAIDAEHAIEVARIVSRHCAGVLAFSQMVDEKADDAEEPVLLARFGNVPPEARSIAA